MPTLPPKTDPAPAPSAESNSSTLVLESEAPKRTLRELWQLFPSTWVLWLLLTLVTAAGAFLRFWRLDHQSFWTDESRTISRISGSFTQLLGALGDQGFPPGWYCLIRWWTMLCESFVGNAAYAPGVIRMLPAGLGTLTIPGIYFLARQFTDRKGSLLVAMLAAVNPFLVYYSRDIKMYPAMWFFLVWNIAFFFKWQTTHRHVIWFPLWVLSGVLMTAMHSMCWFIMALELIFIFTRPRLRPFDGPLWLVGAGVMSLLPLYWYRNGTNWVERVAEQGYDGGLGWITRYTNMSWQTIASLPTSHILGYLWPKYPPDSYIVGWFGLGGDFNNHLETRAWPGLVTAEFWVAIAVGCIMVLGLLPWRGIRRSEERREAMTCGRWWWVLLWLVVPMLFLALTWIPASSAWHKLILGSFNPSPVWEPRYLGIIVPAWLLWLGASLRRLPTWPMRTVAILFVVGVCTISSLTSHLMYRQAPWQRTADAIVKYYDPKTPKMMAIGTPQTAYPGIADLTQIQTARGGRPGRDSAWFIGQENWWRAIADDNYVSFLRVTRLDSDITVIVLTDRLGDEVSDADGNSLHHISDAEVDKILNDRRAERQGVRWVLVRTDTYAWHYEWRFYVFHTWRTRVWIRETVPAATTSNSIK